MGNTFPPVPKAQVQSRRLSSPFLVSPPLVLQQVTLSPFSNVMGNAGGWGQCAVGFFVTPCFLLFSFTAPSFLLISSALAWILPWAAVSSEVSLPWCELSTGHSLLRGIPPLCVAFWVSYNSFFVCPAPAVTTLSKNLPEETEPVALTGCSIGAWWVSAAHFWAGWTQLSPARSPPTQGTVQLPATQILPDVPMTCIQSIYKSFTDVSKYLVEKLIILTRRPYPSFQMPLISLPFLCHCQHFHAYSYSKPYFGACFWQLSLLHLTYLEIAAFYSA